MVRDAIGSRREVIRKEVRIKIRLEVKRDLYLYAACCMLFSVFAASATLGIPLGVLQCESPFYLGSATLDFVWVLLILGCFSILKKALMPDIRWGWIRFALLFVLPLIAYFILLSWAQSTDYFPESRLLLMKRCGVALVGTCIAGSLALGFAPLLLIIALMIMKKSVPGMLGGVNLEGKAYLIPAATPTTFGPCAPRNPPLSPAWHRSSLFRREDSGDI